MNTIGTLLRLTTFGESHGPAMGGILDGMPPRVHIDIDKIQKELNRRKPGSGRLMSQRKESDIPEILSGIDNDGYTLGSPIGFVIRNNDARESDYDNYKYKYRPNHADFTYYKKYGICDWRGGGRASARETVNWVVGGAIVKQWLDINCIEIAANYIETGDVESAAAEGDSVGGMVECTITGVPVGLGEPVFDKLQSKLAQAMMSINAAKCFEYGYGRALAFMRGSECMDRFFSNIDEIGIKDGPCMTNYSGGIQGGLSNGMPINFKVWFKPTPTIMSDIETIDIEGNPAVIKSKGRHDPCVAIRAVAIVEAMAALVIGDMLLISKRLE